MTRTGRTSGFTLIELLVAVSITAVLAAVMLSVTSGTLGAWRRTQDAFTATTQAKLVLDVIERDLQSAIFRPDGGSWMAIDVINDAASLVNHGWLAAAATKPSTGESLRYVPTAAGTRPSNISEARFGLSGTWLRFIATNVESGRSLPVATAYQIARRPVAGAVSPTNPAAVRYTLFRSTVSPDITFNSGYDLMVGYSHSGATPPAQRAAGTVTNPNTTGDAIATNVVDFGVWLYARDAGGELDRLYPESSSDGSHLASSAAAFPEVVDVMLRILTEEGAILIERIESGDQRITRPVSHATDAAWWWAVVEANSRVFTRRVEVKGANR